VGIPLGIMLRTEGLPLWDDGITLPRFMNDDLLHVPKSIDIISEYVLDSNHSFPILQAVS
jgi:hypothetical protein